MKRFLGFIACTFVFVAVGSFRPYPRLGAQENARAPAQIARIFTSQGHSHNDYERAKPLFDALEKRFTSVEADIWYSNGDIRVSHLGFSFAGSLRDLYLEPLQKRVGRTGSVYGDGRPFYLWLDIKSPRPELVEKLHELLSQYPMITKQGSIIVILTGDVNLKKIYTQRYATRFAVRDSNDFTEEDPPIQGPTDAWQWYALNWFKYVNWDGEGKIPEKIAERLKKLVQSAHQKGRKIRFWGAPETPAVWESSAQAGVDLIGTDDLSGVGKLLDVGK